MPVRPLSRPGTAVTALLFVASALLAGNVAAQSTKTETRNVSGYHAVVLGVAAQMEVRQGATEGMTLTGPDALLPQIETVVERGVLKIRWPEGREKRTSRSDALTIIVNVKEIDALTVGGSGEARAAALKTPSLRAVIGGSGTIAIDALDTDSLSTTIGGSGQMTAAGRADILEATVAGSGELKAAKLETKRARVTLQGSSQAAVWATDTLNATVAGSGLVRYFGKPQVSTTIAGSGSVRPAGDAT